MDELFGNIFYLIPVALILSFRILNARKNQARKQQQRQQQQEQQQQQQQQTLQQNKPNNKPASGLFGELIRKVQELENDPNYGKTGKEAYRPHWETKPVILPTGIQDERKKKPIKKPAARQSSLDQSVLVFPDTLPRSAEPLPTTPVQAAVSGLELFQTGISKKPPLQQAVIWAEILGEPKGM